MKSLYAGGLMDYVSDLWNIVDCISNTFYVTWIGLRLTSWYLVQVYISFLSFTLTFRFETNQQKNNVFYFEQRDAAIGLNPWYPREQWDPFDPMLLSEGVFAAGMIFSFLKLVHIFSINPHLGPLQVSLGSILNIHFFFRRLISIFTHRKRNSFHRPYDYRHHQILFYLHTRLVCIWVWYVVAAFNIYFYFTKYIFQLTEFFKCQGLNQLLWYYADLEKKKCYHLHSEIPDFDNNEKACGIWRRFAKYVIMNLKQREIGKS